MHYTHPVQMMALLIFSALIHYVENYSENTSSWCPQPG